MIHVTRPDVEWLLRLLDIVEYIFQEYPELFTEEEEDTLKVAGELIRSLK